VVTASLTAAAAAASNLDRSITSHSEPKHSSEADDDPVDPEDGVVAAYLPQKPASLHGKTGGASGSAREYVLGCHTGFYRFTNLQGLPGPTKLSYWFIYPTG